LRLWQLIQDAHDHREISVDICGACHPFFTGTQKIIDTEGRVERFKKKYAKKDK